MSAFSKLLTGFSSLMLIGAIAAVPACGNNDDDDDGGAGAGAGGDDGASGKGGKGGSSGSSGAGGKGGASGSGGKGGTGGSSGSGAAGEAGNDGSGGAPDSAGGAGGEPASSGGTAGSSAGEGGSGGAGEPEIAVVKFCNNVGLEGEDGDVEFTLRVGTGDGQVTLEALTGTCAPLDGACPELATGNDVPFTILDHEGDPYFEGTFEVAAGDQLVIFAEYDDEAEETTADIVELGSDECSEVDYEDFYSEE